MVNSLWCIWVYYQMTSVYFQAILILQAWPAQMKIQFRKPFYYSRLFQFVCLEYEYHTMCLKSFQNKSKCFLKHFQNNLV